MITDKNKQIIDASQATGSTSAVDKEVNPYSISNIYAQNEQRKSEKNKQLEYTRQLLNKSMEDGANLRLSLVESMKPQRDEEQEKKSRQTAKIMAIGDLLSSLAGGIIGGTSSGYVAKNNSSYTTRLIDSLRRREADYSEQQKAYTNSRLQAQSAQQQAEYNRLLNEYNNTSKDLASLEMRGDELNEFDTKRLISLRDKKVLATQALKDWSTKNQTEYSQRVALENRRSRNRKNERLSQQQKNDNKYSFKDKYGNTVSLSDAEYNDMYDWGVKNGIIKQEGANVLSNPTKVNGIPQEYIPYRYKNQSPEHRMQLLKEAYDKRVKAEPKFRVNNVKRGVTAADFWEGF